MKKADLSQKAQTHVLLSTGQAVLLQALMRWAQDVKTLHSNIDKQSKEQFAFQIQVSCFVVNGLESLRLNANQLSKKALFNYFSASFENFSFAQPKLNGVHL